MIHVPFFVREKLLIKFPFLFMTRQVIWCDVSKKDSIYFLFSVGLQ